MQDSLEAQFIRFSKTKSPRNRLSCLPKSPTRPLTRLVNLPWQQLLTFGVWAFLHSSFVRLAYRWTVAHRLKVLPSQNNSTLMESLTVSSTVGSLTRIKETSWSSACSMTPPKERQPSSYLSTIGSQRMSRSVRNNSQRPGRSALTSLTRLRLTTSHLLRWTILSSIYCAQFMKKEYLTTESIKLRRFLMHVIFTAVPTVGFLLKKSALLLTTWGSSLRRRRLAKP